MTDFSRLSDLQLDLACAIIRIEQYRETGWEDLLERIYTCDVPRLKEHLVPEALELLEMRDE